METNLQVELRKFTKEKGKGCVCAIKVEKKKKRYFIILLYYRQAMPGHFLGSRASAFIMVAQEDKHCK